MNINKVFILGRLTIDPVARATPSGVHVTNFGVATNRVWYNKDKQKQEEVEFHNVVAWGKQAELITKYLAKGSLIFIEGRLQTRQWQDKTGGQRKTTEIIAENIQLGPRAMNQGGSASAPRAEAPVAPEKPPEVPVIDIDEDNINPEDLPF